MLTILVQSDTDDLAARLNASIRFYGNPQLLKTLNQWGEEANRHDALAGVDRHGKGLVPTWEARRGRSDYHGRDYAAYTNATTLIPFGRQSRRIDAHVVEVRRRTIGGIGFGAATVRAGFSPRAGLIPSHWKARGWDVLGMSPRTMEGYRRLLHSHSTAGHRLLKKGGAAGRAASRAAAALF